MITPPDNSSLYRTAEGYEQVLAHYDRTFHGMGIPYEIKYVETHFGPTHTVIAGNEEGKVIALWHGLNANSTTWASWIRSLAPTYRVYAIDTIGAMGKSAASRPARKGPAYGKWAAEALEGLGLKGANMIGASNGGWLIGKLASVAPEMIGSAVLMSSAGLLALSMVQALRMLPRILFKPPPVTAPTYLLMGEYEISFNPYKAIKRGLSLIPNVISAEIVPGIGHAMVHRQSDWVIARVTSFLEKRAV